MKFIILFIALVFSAASGLAQTKKTVVKKPEPKSPTVKKTEPKPIAAPVISELTDAEWKSLTAELLAENWTNSAALAAQYLRKLKNDNEKKQLAQLRYFYLYSLAGKILAANTAAVENESLWKDLNEAVGGFVGKEIVAPPRRFLPECREVLNYICPVKTNEKTLRVTATNQEGTMIHSFDYFSFDEKVATGEFADGEIFLGGKLKTAEFNQDSSKLWVMRLFFENGFVKVVGK